MATATLSPAADTYVQAGLPNAAASQAGNAARLLVGYNGRTGENEWRSYIRFDLSSIPAGSTINSAFLRVRVFFSETVDYGSQEIGAFLTGTTTWNETMTWNTQPDDIQVPATDTNYFDASISIDFDFTVTGDVATYLVAANAVSWILMPVNTAAFSDLYTWHMQDADYTTGPPALSRSQLIIDYTAPVVASSAKTGVSNVSGVSGFTGESKANGVTIVVGVVEPVIG